MATPRLNRAAWLVQRAQPLVVKPAPYPIPGSKQIVLQSHAVAINPIDRMLQAMGSMLFSWIKLPMISGSDVAGEVVEVGADVKRFAPGDRVYGLALAFTNSTADSSQGAFQEYVLLREDLCALMPATMEFEEAVVMPLGISTAACGLYQEDYLGLDLPMKGRPSPRNGRAIIVWGGSTSVGMNAVQLGNASGYDVITTCSPRNFDMVKRLGATEVFDYNSPTVVDDVVSALQGKFCSGALSIGSGAVQKCLEILTKTKSANKFVAMASAVVQPVDAPDGLLGLLMMLFTMAFRNLQIWWKCRRHGLKTKFIFGTDLEANEVGPAIWQNFVSDALSNGSLVASPKPLVIETRGLEGIQTGLERHKQGVSASKVVVRL